MRLRARLALPGSRYAGPIRFAVSPAPTLVPIWSLLSANQRSLAGCAWVGREGLFPGALPQYFLRLRIALSSGFAEPLRGLALILRYTATRDVHQGEI